MTDLNRFPIWRDANRLLLAIGQAVRRFPQYQKYSLGTELRRQAMDVCRLILRVANHGDDQLRYFGRLVDAVDAVDDRKLEIQFGKELFERCSIDGYAASLGKARASCAPTAAPLSRRLSPQRREASRAGLASCLGHYDHVDPFHLVPGPLAGPHWLGWIFESPGATAERTDARGLVEQTEGAGLMDRRGGGPHGGLYGSLGTRGCGAYPRNAR